MSLIYEGENNDRCYACDGNRWRWDNGEKIICGECEGTGLKLTDEGQEAARIFWRLISTYNQTRSEE